MNDDDIIAWLRSEEGEDWSRNRHQSPFYEGQEAALPWAQRAGDLGEDPCGRPPISPGEAA